MPVTAKFQADFSDFHKGVAEADAKLHTFGASAGKVGTKLNDLGAAGTATVLPFNTLGGSLRQFDGVLSAVGVNIGPQIRGLEDLATASGKSAKELGGFAVAGLAVGALTFGISIGRWVSNFFDLDQKIGNATAKLLGWGDVAAETAGAKADVLARATKNAGRAITDYTEAIAINIRHLKETQAGNQAGWALRGYITELEKASTQVSNLNTHQKHLIDRGVALNKSNADIAKGLSITTDAVDTYVEAWRASEAATKKAAAEAEALAKVFKALQDNLFGVTATSKAAEYARALGGVQNVTDLTKTAMADFNKVMGEAYTVLVRAGQGASATAVEYLKLRNASTDFAAINASLAAMPDPYAAKQRERMEKIADTEKAILRQNAGLTDSQQYWQHAGEIADAEMAKARAAVETIGPAASTSAGRMSDAFSFAFQGIANDAATTSARINQLMGDAAKNILRGGIAATYGFYQQQQITALQNPMQGFAAGGPVTKDGPIYAHAGEYVLPKGGGGGTTVNINAININGQGAEAGRETVATIREELMRKGVRI